MTPATHLSSAISKGPYFTPFLAIGSGDQRWWFQTCHAGAKTKVWTLFMCLDVKMDAVRWFWGTKIWLVFFRYWAVSRKGFFVVFNNFVIPKKHGKKIVKSLCVFGLLFSAEQLNRPGNMFPAQLIGISGRPPQCPPGNYGVMAVVGRV